MVGLNDVVEVTALDNRKFIQVIFGDEPNLALLDPGPTISLVGLLNKCRD